ncbi:MAG: metalloregulator ArsR/SmtB family transcription factor [Chloroflexota bacterium]|nr:metalloregulator ArsR/SmtB family transcription factor [Chloroflexota bacterium]
MPGRPRDDRGSAGGRHPPLDDGGADGLDDLGRQGHHLLTRERLATFADLSHARTVHLLAISEQDLCVCDIALVLGMSVSALSHQLRFLRERGAVERRKAGRIADYRLVDDHLRELILGAATHVAEHA